MGLKSSTVDVEYFERGDGTIHAPGLVVAFSEGQAQCRIVSLKNGPVEIGRSTPDGLSLADPAMSRRHAKLSFMGDAFYAEDLGSKNGLVVDGRKVNSGGRLRLNSVLRLGETVLVVVKDIGAVRGAMRIDGETVIGPSLQRVYEAVDAIAESGTIVHLRGEVGTGKTLVARRFHESCKRRGPFVGVKSAALGSEQTLRLLFGGGEDGAASEPSEGLVDARTGGTLFLQDLHALDERVQWPLVGIFEHAGKEGGEQGREVGSSSAPVDLALVSASDRDLREEVAAGRLAEELFFRIGRPEVRVSPLRERPEEMAYHLEATLRTNASALQLSAGIVEACLLRPWPGNFRELRLEVCEAIRRAQQASATTLAIEHLDKKAGREFQIGYGAMEASSGQRIDKSMLPERDAILAILRDTGGRVATAARQMGVHRNQLRRWLAANDVDPRNVLKQPES